MTNDFRSELNAAIAGLDSEQQETVLAFVQMLREKPKGFSSEQFSEFSGTLSPEEAAEMQRVVKEGCGKVDTDGW